MFMTHSTFTPEFKALAHIISSNNAKEAQKALVGIDLETFLDLAVRHRVIGHVELALGDGRNIFSQQQAFNTLAAKHRDQVLKLIMEVNVIQSTLAHAAIEPIILKGPPLSFNLFGNAFIRHAGDLDWWISESEIPAAFTLLTNIGYQEKTLFNTLTPTNWSFLRKVRHDLVFIHKQTKQINEVHWQVYELDSVFPKKLALQMQMRAITYPFGEMRIRMLSAEDQFLYLCNHGSRHRWSSLHWLLDVYQFLRSDSAVDLNTIANIANEYGLLNQVNLAIVLCNTLFGSQYPPIGKYSPLMMDWLRKKCLAMLQLDAASVRKLDIAHYRFSDVIYFFVLRPNFGLFAEYTFMVWLDPSIWQYLQLPEKFFWLYIPLRPFNRIIKWLNTKNRN